MCSKRKANFRANRKMRTKATAAIVCFQLEMRENKNEKRIFVCRKYMNIHIDHRVSNRKHWIMLSGE